MTKQSNILLGKTQSLGPISPDGWLKLMETRATTEKWIPDEDQLRITIQGEPHGPSNHNLQATSSPGSTAYFERQKASLSRDSVLPEKILCAINVRVKDEVFLFPALVEFSLFDPAFYSMVEDLMQAFASHQGEDGKRVYNKATCLSLLEMDDFMVREVDTRVIKAASHWNDHVRRSVVKYCSKNDTTRFFLEIRAHYEWLVFTENHPDIMRAVQEVLQKEELSNFDGQTYWPKQVFKILFSPETVRCIVNAVCPSSGSAHHANALRLTEAEKTDFVEWLLKDRIRLLAACIRCRIDLCKLYKLMRSQRGRELMDHDDWFCDDNLQIFLQDQWDLRDFKSRWGGFRPFTFPEPGRPHTGNFNLNDHQVVPMHYDKRNPIGEGSSKRVFKAMIHGDYHELSSDRAEVLALKVIEGEGRRMERTLQEVHAWKDLLRMPHPCITHFHAWWIQNKTFYILSPLADMDLRTFLKSEVFNFNDLGWLLEQLEGLTSAVQHIHHIGRATLDLPRRLGEARPEYGYHHDLKPANILIHPGKQWKVTDFGTMKVRHDNSGPLSRMSPRTFNFADGDVEYGAPDYWIPTNLKKGLGQEYDIWSLGCIFLEVMLWVFCQQEQEIEAFRAETFRKRRAAETDTGCKCLSKTQIVDSQQRIDTGDSEEYQDSDSEGDQQQVPKRRIDISGVIEASKGIPNFWFMCDKRRQCHRKQCVWQEIQHLRSKTKRHKNWLFGLCDEIKAMLNPNPEKRPKASNILDILGVLRTKASRESNEQRPHASKSRKDQMQGQSNALPTIICPESDNEYGDDHVEPNAHRYGRSQREKRRYSQAESAISNETWSVTDPHKSSSSDAERRNQRSENDEAVFPNEPDEARKLSPLAYSGHRHPTKRRKKKEKTANSPPSSSLSGPKTSTRAEMYYDSDEHGPSFKSLSAGLGYGPSDARPSGQLPDAGRSQEDILEQNTTTHEATKISTAVQGRTQRSRAQPVTSAPWTERFQLDKDDKLPE